MSRVEIKAILPFNESVFNDCTYPIRFSILRHFGRIIDPLVLNEYDSFGCVRDEQLDRSVLFVKAHFVARPDAVLSNVLGVKQTVKARCSHVIEDLEEAIAAGQPAMVWVDRFYQPYVAPYFNRHHHLHAVLVHAHDRDARTFGVFDDNAGGRPEQIVPCELSYEDLVRAYASCHQVWPRQIEGQPTFVAFSTDEPPADPARATAVARATFIEASLRHRDAIAAGLDELEQFVRRFEEEARRPPMAQALGLYHSVFRRVAEFKATERYQARYVLDGPRHAVEAEADALVKAWNRMHLLLLRAGLDGRPAALTACVADVTARLYAAVELERRYHATYFDALEAATARMWLAPFTSPTHRSSSRAADSNPHLREARSEHA